MIPTNSGAATNTEAYSHIPMSFAQPSNDEVHGEYPAFDLAPLPVEPESKPMCEGCEQVLAQYARALELLTENQQRMTDRMDAVVKGYNGIGAQVQNITSGLGGLFAYFTSITEDLKSMSLTDKIKIMKELVSNNGG